MTLSQIDDLCLFGLPMHTNLSTNTHTKTTKKALIVDQFMIYAMGTMIKNTRYS